MTITLPKVPHRVLSSTQKGPLCGTSDRQTCFELLQVTKEQTDKYKSDRNGLRCICFLSPQKNPGIK